MTVFPVIAIIMIAVTYGLQVCSPDLSAMRTVDTFANFRQSFLSSNGNLCSLVGWLFIFFRKSVIDYG